MTDRQKLGPAHEYLDDAWQRSILFLDVLRQRGNVFTEQQAKEAPNVLDFDAELIMDGRTFKRPVNYLLVRIKPLDGQPTDPAKRPFVVVDPRAGHGPGIGGMKKDSEIGVAMANGHPCYFIGFLPDSMPDQTIEDVWNAEADFIRRGRATAPGKWQACIDRELPGWLADGDHGSDAPGDSGSAPARWGAPVLLGRRSGQEPDALSRWNAGRDPG